MNNYQSHSPTTDPTINETSLGCEAPRRAISRASVDMLDEPEPQRDTDGWLTTFDRRVGRVETLVTPTRQRLSAAPGTSALHRDEQIERSVDRTVVGVEPGVIYRFDATHYQLNVRTGTGRARVGEVAVHAPGNRMCAIRSGASVWHLRVALLGAKLRG